MAEKQLKDLKHKLRNTKMVTGKTIDKQPPCPHIRSIKGKDGKKRLLTALVTVILSIEALLERLLHGDSFYLALKGQYHQQSSFIN